MTNTSPPGARKPGKKRGSENRGARSWQQNAAEYAAYTQGDGWMYSLLAGCSVERGVHGQRGTLPTVIGKVSVREFAGAAHSAPATVARALDAWDRLAAEGVVPPSADLSPSDVPLVVLPDNSLYPWDRYAEKKERDYEAERLRAMANNIPPEKIAAALRPEQRAAVVEAAVQQASFEDLQRLRNQAEEKIAARAPEVNADNARFRAQREAETARSSSFWRFNDISGQIAAARDKVRAALRVAQSNDQFTDEERAAMATSLDRLDAASGLLRLAVTGTANIDWDAELARMGEGS